VKTVIRSTIGGNLRLRVPNEMRLSNGTGFRHAVGENTNPFYETEIVKDPGISEKAIITPVVLGKTFLYDILSKPGQILTLISK
jgi:alpha-L-fucosidase 2